MRTYRVGMSMYRLPIPALVVASWACLSVSSPSYVHARLPSFLAGFSPVGRVADTALRFEPNVGQTDPCVRFLARGTDYTAFLTTTEVVLVAEVPRPKGVRVDAKEAVLRLRFMGANPRMRVSGSYRLSGADAYLLGSDTRRWRTGIPAYAHVVYRDLYPGVNLVYGGNGGQLEDTYIVAAGSSPSRIRFDVRGTYGLPFLDRHGSLILPLLGGMMREDRLMLYQVVAGRRQSVAGQYVVHGTTVGVVVGRYDHRRPLVIDPPLVYGTYLGSGDAGLGMALDRAGHVYVIGTTRSSSFPTTRGTLKRTNTSISGGIVFVTKLGSDGRHLLASTLLGGTGGASGYGDRGNAITVDGAGHMYVTGYTYSHDFPTTVGAAQRTNRSATGSNAFVAELSADGQHLLYSTLIGGHGQGDQGDVGVSLAIDAVGHAYVTGLARSTDFPTTVHAFQTHNASTYHSTSAFIAGVGPGGRLLYSTLLGGNGIAGELVEGDFGLHVAADTLGDTYIAGFTTSSNFPTTTHVVQRRPGGGEDAFVVKLSADGRRLIYSTYIGGNADDRAYRITVDSTGNAYVTGFTYSTSFSIMPRATTQQPIAAHAFVAKLSPDGRRLVYVTRIGDRDHGQDIVVDSNGRAYIVGSVATHHLATTTNAFQRRGRGVSTAFVAELDTDGQVLYSTYLGGGSTGSTAPEEGTGIATDGIGHVYVTGYTFSRHFSTTAGSLSPASHDGQEAFVVELDVSPH